MKKNKENIAELGKTNKELRRELAKKEAVRLSVVYKSTKLLLKL